MRLGKNIFWAVFTAGQMAAPTAQCPFPPREAEAVVWETARAGDDTAVADLFWQLVGRYEVHTARADTPLWD